MDLWVVAAAAGVGYIAKNLQNLSVDKKDSPVGFSDKNSHNFESESRTFLQQLRDKTCPLRKLAEKRALDDSFREMGNNSGTRVSEIGELLDNRNGGSDVTSTSSDDCNLGWNSRLPSVFSTEWSLEFEECKNWSSSGAKRGNFIRNRMCQVHPVRGFSSLETCLDGQQCSENDEGMEESACLYPPVSPVRPVLVTDWGGMAGRSVCPAEDLQRKPRRSSGDLRLQDSGEAMSGRSSNLQGHDTMLLFISGMIIGILAATMGWNNEVDKLNKLLKQMQSLVQDLQEELEMKEMLMVKELPNEVTAFPGECYEPLPVQEQIASPSDVTVNRSTKFEMLKANDKHMENLESLSCIEAELQAELETLEHNINTSVMERISGVVELDPDFEPDIVQGDLKPAVMNDPSESVDESTDPPTNCSQPANYSVSPLELSLRLHELIESRLQARIKELETALSKSLNTVQVLNSESARRFSHSETESSSAHETPTCICDKQNKNEDWASAEISFTDYADAWKAPSMTIFGTAKQDRPVDSVQDIPIKSFQSNQDSESEDESEMLLIKRIIERTKSGSNCKLEIDWGLQ